MKKALKKARQDPTYTTFKELAENIIERRENPDGRKVDALANLLKSKQISMSIKLELPLAEKVLVYSAQEMRSIAEVVRLALKTFLKDVKNP